MSLAARYGGEDATLLAVEGETLSFVGPRALAPGAPVILEVPRSGAPLALEGRSLGSRRTPSGEPRFEIRARLVNLRKIDREWLLAALASGG